MPNSNPSPVQQAAQHFVEQNVEKPALQPRVMIPHDGYKISASAESLFTEIAKSGRFFYRGGAVVELVDDPDDGFISQPLVPAAAVSRFENHVCFTKPAKEGKQPTLTNINEQTAKLYLKTDAARDCLPRLNGIVNCPILVEKDGRLIEVDQGYSTETGYYVTADKPAETVDLEFAVGILGKILNDFDFVMPGDRSRAIASFITPALKLGGFIQGPVPVEVAEADKSQSGKGYRQKIIAAIYNQKLAIVTKKKGGVGSFEESFCEHLIKGRAFIQFDNLRGKLDSQFLESFVTADGPFLARVPNLGSMNVDPSKFLLFISSNGFEATKDLANRASIVGIRKRAPSYQFDQFDGGRDLLGFVKFIQPVLISAVFAVVREWHRRGKLRTNETRHDFREWCQVLDWIVQNIFHSAPLMDGHAGAQQRAANPNLSFLRILGIKLLGRRAMGHPLSATDISQLCLEEDIEIPGVKMEDQTVEQGPQQIGRIMGPFFEDAEEVQEGEFRVTRTSDQQISDAGHAFEAYRYTFSQIPQPAANPVPATAPSQNP